MSEEIRPDYYKGNTGMQVFDVINEFNLDFYIGNVIKYLFRAGKKEGNCKLKDLEKAETYLRYVISKEEGDN